MSFDPSSIKIDAAKFSYDVNIPEALAAQELLESKNGKGNDFLGWLDLPLNIESNLIHEIHTASEKLKKLDCLVLVGIGGSYLGARAVIESLRNPFEETLPVHYLGHNLDAAYYSRLLRHLSSKNYGVNVISKSGTTTEPAVAFRYIWQDMKKRFDADYIKNAVVVTTDESKGSLRHLADAEKLSSFIVPDDVGGRYSVFTPVGLLPIAAAGFDIEALLDGAKAMRNYLKGADFDTNPALQYAAFRHAGYRNGKKIEIMASYNSSLVYFAEWWKQLYGESEGKDGRGIFPASVNLTTDLHSMGQWMQDGERNIMETVIDVRNTEDIVILSDDKNEDGLNYLAGKGMNEINRTALQATLNAHSQGGVPCMRLEIPEIHESVIGAMMYMFEYACGVSAYILQVNPFDQPGVEAYKSEMFRLLKKPGYQG